MPRTSRCGAFLLASTLLLSASLAWAAPRSPAHRRDLRHRTLAIDDESLGSLPEIRVAGGSPSVLTFPVAVKDGGALVSSVRKLFYPPTQTDKTVILVPKADLTQPAALNVSLVDGTVLSFKLLSVPDESDVQVDVQLALKSRAAPESVAALRSTIDQLRGELEELRAGSANTGATKLAALLLNENLDEPQAFERRPLRGGDKQDRLLVQARWSYRFVGLTLLVLTVENRDPQKLWVLDRAEVRLTGGAEATDLKVLASSPEMPVLAPDIAERLVVAFATPQFGPGQKLRLTLIEKDGPRRFVLDGLSP